MKIHLPQILQPITQSYNKRNYYRKDSRVVQERGRTHRNFANRFTQFKIKKKKRKEENIQELKKFMEGVFYGNQTRN